jgi:hypothetical protein
MKNLQEHIRKVLKEEVESVDMKTTQSELTNILGPSKIKNGNRVEYKHNFGSFDSSFNIVVDRLDQKTLVVINNFMTKKGWFPTSVGLSGMKQHTYSNSVQNYIGKDDVEIGYEVKTGKEINLKQSKVYHVTPDTFVDSIIKNGINLKSESKLGDHPERIYLYLNKNNSKDMVTTLWNSLSQERKQIIKNYYVLEIDLSQIPNHKFYNDPASMVTLEAIYTNQPIPKSAVKVIDKINTNSLKTYDEDKIMTPEQEREEREKRKRKEEEKIRKEKEDSIRDSENKKSYEQIPNDIKNMSIDDLFESKNLQEHIRKVLREETNNIKMLLRRLPPEKLEKMDEEFDHALNYISKLFLKNFKANPRKLSEKEFTRMVMIDLITLLELRQYLPDDVEWYEDVTKGLSKHYEKRISSMYRVLKKD